MIVDKEIVKVWNAEVDKKNLLIEAKNIGCDVRTLENALKKGKCHQNVYKKINAYLLKKRKQPKNPLLLK